MERRVALIAPLALSACTLLGPRPGPPPEAPTESALATAKPPDVCKVSPSSLRKVGALEAGATPFGEVVAALGRPRDGAGDRACWVPEGGSDVALFVHGQADDRPIRSLALSKVDEAGGKGCTVTEVLPSPVSLAAGLRLGMARPEVERILGPVEPDDGGAFGKECCGLEQTGEGERGPVYTFGCSAVLGAFRDGQLVSLLVSRYAPPDTGAAQP